jgi:hypothetical protein
MDFDGKAAIDSFYLYPPKNSFDSSQNEYLYYIQRTLNTKHVYHFFISDSKPFILENMKMVVWSQWTMGSEGYGCVMGEYTLDGKRFQHDTSPQFRKK